MISLKSALTIFITVFIILIIFAIVYELQILNLLKVQNQNKPLSNALTVPNPTYFQKTQSNLNRTQIVGQMLMTTLSGYKLTEEEKYKINTGRISNILLLSKNIQNIQQLKQLTADIYQQASFSAVLPLIAVDQEGGLVSRIPWIEKTAQNLIDSEDQAYKTAWIRGQQLKELGINTNFAPVVESMFPNSFIAKQKRGFASQSAVLAKAMLRGYQQAGILAVAKHFPAGLGHVAIDPHQKMPVLNSSAEEIISDITPFTHMINDPIMVTHLLYPAVDASPASASFLFLSSILRQDMGHKSVIISDDISMGAIRNNYNIAYYAKNSLQAGCDMIIISSDQDFNQVYDYLMQSYLGEFEYQATVEKHVANIIELKRTKFNQ